jgi:hypothetical protein
MEHVAGGVPSPVHRQKKLRLRHKRLSVFHVKLVDQFEVVSELRRHDLRRGSILERKAQ